MAHSRYLSAAAPKPEAAARGGPATSSDGRIRVREFRQVHRITVCTLNKNLREQRPIQHKGELFGSFSRLRCALRKL